MLRLDSDWIRPVTVTLTNATVSSSEVIGSACHVTKIIDEQMIQLTLPLKCELEGYGVSGLDTGSTVVDLGSSDLETGSGAFKRESVFDPGNSGLDPGSTVDPVSSDLETESASAAPGCSDTVTGSSDDDTGSRGQYPVFGLCDPGKAVPGSGIDVCEPGGSVSEPKCDVIDAGCSLFGSKVSNRPGSRSRAHEQDCDLGRYGYQCVKFSLRDLLDGNDISIALITLNTM